MKLSFSAINSFKACPQRFKLSYVEGIRKIEKSDALRIGSSWHEILQKFHDSNGDWEAVAALLNERYEQVPDNKSIEEWALERETLSTSLVAYVEHYAESEDDFETIATELEIKLPIFNPDTRRPVLKAYVVGYIDRILSDGYRILIEESKTTSKPIDPGSSYWERLRLDSQISIYVLGARYLQKIGKLPQDIPVSGVLYSVFHKPGIKPKNLTKADLKLLKDRGVYHNRKFEYNPSLVRETTGMYSARLLSDLRSRTNFYFARREIARTDKDLDEFQRELYHIHQAISGSKKQNCFFKNENSCEQPFKCDFIPICYRGLDTSDERTPLGFRRIAKEHRA